MMLALPDVLRCIELLQVAMNSENVSPTTLDALQCLEQLTITKKLLRKTKVGFILNTFAKRGPKVWRSQTSNRHAVEAAGSL